MGTISDKLMRIINTKEDIRQALISKGYDVPTSIPFKEYAKMILDLPCKVDSFPDIEGIVARYSASGLTNEQMAANPVWVDKTGNGHDLQMKNFSWGGMSGVGGYGDENYQTFYKFTLDDYVFIASPPGVKHMNFTFRVTGLQPGNKLTLAFFGTTNTVYGTWNKDGIYTVDADIVEAGKPTYFYNGYGATRGEFTIEILPLYPGFILGDGVDDFAITEKDFNFEKEFCVYLAAIFFPQDSPRNEAILGKDSNKDIRVLQYNNNLTFNSGNHTYCSVNLGQFSIVAFKRKDDTLLAKNLTTGVSNSVKATSSVLENPDKFYLWVIKGFFGYSDAAIAGSIIVNGRFTTDEDDEKILDWYKQEYPWLFPDQGWTVTGKTNEDEDRATIANITGNGNDLILSNFGFAEGSGYGLYGVSFDRWRIEKAEHTTASKDSISAVFSSINTVNFTLLFRLFASETKDAVVNSFKIKVNGLVDGQTLLYNSIIGGKISTAFTITKDGVYELPSIQGFNGGDYYGFAFSKVQETCDITIEQIPEYEGYLVTDGVDDMITSSAFQMGKDFTVVGEWRFIIDERKVAGLIKPPSFYLFNENNGLKLFINNTEKSSSLNTKSLKAICSDGRVYFDDWSEMLLSEEQPITSSSKDLSIGYNSTIYTQMAFKNLGIYNDQLLSKDDCIKAYNYLQTLKAK